MLVYSAGLMSQSFWYVEFKQIVKMLNSGDTYERIKQKCLEENLFGAAREYRARRIYGYIINRIKTMDDTLIKIFCDADLATQKIINLITILRLDRLFFEFIYEVYREKIILGIPYIEDSDLNIFFKEKMMQSEDIGKWKESTIKHLKSNYLRFLIEANLLCVKDKKKKITPPILDIELERYLQDIGEQIMVKALTGVN